jgi:hypothetical protein
MKQAVRWYEIDISLSPFPMLLLSYGHMFVLKLPE